MQWEKKNVPGRVKPIDRVWFYGLIKIIEASLCILVSSISNWVTYGEVSPQLKRLGNLTKYAFERETKKKYNCRINTIYYDGNAQHAYVCDLAFGGSFHRLHDDDDDVEWQQNIDLIGRSLCIITLIYPNKWFIKFYGIDVNYLSICPLNSVGRLVTYVVI